MHRVLSKRASLGVSPVGKVTHAAKARIEHVLARMKDWQILRQCRRRGEAINYALQAVAYLYNIKFGYL